MVGVDGDVVAIVSPAVKCEDDREYFRNRQKKTETIWMCAYVCVFMEKKTQRRQEREITSKKSKRILRLSISFPARDCLSSIAILIVNESIT